MNETTASKRLFVDMDGTLAEFKVVDTLERLYEPGYFLNLEPNVNVVSAIKELIDNHKEIDVYIMSAVLSDSKYALNEKKEWLQKHLPEISMEKCIFPPCGSDKKDFIPNGVRSDDFLLDDYSVNLNAWEPPARGIKLLNGINGTHGTWNKDSVSYLCDSGTLCKSICSIINENQRIVDKNPMLEEKLAAMEKWTDEVEKNQTQSRAERTEK